MPLALLTGGGSLIGEGIARCLVTRGWTVVVTDVDLELARKSPRRRAAPRTPKPCSSTPPTARVSMPPCRTCSRATGALTRS
jgi:NAD(P)-dependent dehydrogenase (short-subunit alcohol dehydrogenase family)